MSDMVKPEHQTEEYLRPLVRLAKMGDREASEELVRVMRPLVKTLVKTENYTPDQMAEQEGAGWVGLWEAVNRYDEHHEAGKTFWLVAWYRIRHEIQEWLARNSGAVPMPRSSAWQKAQDIDFELAAYADQYPEQPFPEQTLSDDELDEVTGVRNTRSILLARAESMPFDPLLAEDDELPWSDSAEDAYFDGSEADLDRATLAFLVLLDDLDPEEWEGAALDFCDEWDLPYEVADRIIEVKRGGLT